MTDRAMTALTVFVRSLPASASNARLEEIFSEIGPVKHCFVVKEKGAEKCRGIGYVTYSMAEDAHRAVKEVNDYDGQRIAVSVAKKKIYDKKKKGASKEPASKEPASKEPASKEPASKEPASKEPASKESAPKEPATPKEPKSKGIKNNNRRKARLIIRNLSFKCSEDDLKQAFAKFGTVLEANIPLKPDGKMRGFAFVQFKNVLEAGKALNGLNLKEIKGRQVAVDWAVAKDKFVATQPPAKSGPKKEETVVAEKPAPKSDSSGDDAVKPKDKKVKVQTGTRKQKKKEKEEEEDEEEEQNEEEEEEEEEVKPIKKAVTPPKKKKKASSKPVEQKADSQSEEEEEDADAESQDADDDDDDDDDQSDLGSDDEDDDDDDEDDDSDRPTKKKKMILPSDINQGKTIFIRNLSFDTEEEGLEQGLLQFGELNYIKICLHPDTEHSKGVAFAQYKSKEAAQRCIAASEDESETGGVRVDGRKLNVVAAVSRDDAVKLKDKKVKVQTGTRNMYLAREGLIRAGTKSAEGVPAADMAKRLRFEELKRTKLRSISVFVSKTRLCVHNLPKSVDVKQLRKLCLKAAGGGMEARISECRVMYDKKPEKGQVSGRSLGYGFVQFQDHEHALKTLRHLNNNPDIYGPTKRPIVEFSLEDGRKLKMKELRQQQSKERFQRGRAKVEANQQPEEPQNGVARPQGPQKGVARPQGPQNGVARPQGPQKGVARPQGGVAKPQGGAAATGPAKASTQPSPSSHAGKDRVIPAQAKTQIQTTAPAHTKAQTQKQGGQFSGFQSTPEVEHVELQDGKKRRTTLTFPSHRGPKIRLRDKGKPQILPPKPKNRPSRKDRLGQSLEKPTQPKPQSAKGKAGKKRSRNREDDRFDNLVEQYKKKLMGGSKPGAAVKRNKWFDS